MKLCAIPGAGNVNPGSLSFDYARTTMPNVVVVLKSTPGEA